MKKEKLLRLVNQKYKQLKIERFGGDSPVHSYPVNEIQSDQVRSLIEIISPFLDDGEFPKLDSRLKGGESNQP
jgi:hypothetical protein